MIELTEPQVWVLIGVFATAILGMLSWQTVSINRTIVSAVGRVDAKIDGLREVTDLKFEALRSDLASTRAQIDSLDRDVQALTRHVFGAGPR